MSENQNPKKSIYEEFNYYLDQHWMVTILNKLMPLLEKENVAIFGKVSVIKAYRRRLSTKEPPTIEIELYLSGGWMVDVTITHENKIYASVHGQCENEE